MSLTKTELDLILNGIDTVRSISQNTLNEVKGHEKRIGSLEAHCENTERIFDEILDRTTRIKKISSDKISRPPRRLAKIDATTIKLILSIVAGVVAGALGFFTGSIF